MFNYSLMASYFDRIVIGEDKYYAYENVWTEYATELFTSVFLYLAIALTVILLAVGVFVKFKKSEAFSAYVKNAIMLAIGFAVTVIVVMLTLGFAKTAEKGYAEYEGLRNLVLIPACVLGGIAVLGIAASYVSSLFGGKAFKITLIASASAIGAAFIAILVCLLVYLTSGNAEANNWVEITATENVVLYVSAAALIVVIAALAFFFGKGEKSGYDSKSIAYAAVCIALSFALSYIKFWQMPQGGSLTLASLVPLMVYSYMFGVRKGVIAGLIYGILQAIQDPWLIHPAQFLLDYPVAFASIGLAGLFAKIKALDKIPQVKFALGAVVASCLRFISHVLSGVFAFSEYSTLDNVWAYSLGYNSFVFVDIAIAIVVGVILFSSKAFIAQVRRIQAVAFKPVASSNGEQAAQD